MDEPSEKIFKTEKARASRKYSRKKPRHVAGAGFLSFNL
jgi:hypothetical protein